MLRDILWGFRRLRQNRLFAAAVIIILALGIGANTAVFTIVDAVLIRPLPYDSADRLVRIEESSHKRPSFGIPAQDYLGWRGRTDLFEKVAAHIRDIVTVTGGGEPQQVVIQRVSDGLFSLVHARAQLGRALVDSDNDFRAPNAAVLSDRLWRQLFRGDPAVLGRSITIADDPYTIVGVMSRDFEFPYRDAEIWVPLRLAPSADALVEVVARTRPKVPLSQVQGAMAIAAHQLEERDPQKRAGLQINVSPWREVVARQYELTLIFILAAVGLVLLIACADVGGLLLSRAVQRQKEIAIRASLGAGFWRVARQFLVESLVLALLGSAAGMAVAHYVLRFLTGRLAALPIVLPHMERVAMNERVLIFNAVLCLVLACLCCLAPVLLVRKTDLQSVLRTGHGGGSRGSTRLFGILIGAEAAFAFLLLVGSGLMVRSLIRLQQADHGFRPDHVLTMRVPVGAFRQSRPGGKYDTKPRQMAYYHEILERLQQIPGVRSVALTNNLPLSGANTTIALQTPDGELLGTSTRTISPQYFAAMGMELVAGRIFTDADDAAAPRVAIVNEYLARQLFPGRNPLGQTLPAAEGPRTTEIVGVVKDSSQGSIEQPAKGEVYAPYRQFIFGVFLTTFVVRTQGDPWGVAGAMRKEVWAVDANQAIVKVETMNDVIADSIWRPRFSAWMFSVLGGLALLLTSAGVYSVVAYTSTLRSKEVGIRVALGATPGRVIALIVRDSLIPLAAGLVVSLAATLLLSRLLTSLLYEIGSADPITYIGAAALLLGIGGVASARPAWKAAAGDPLASLRME
jgi:putative ABC transport system permease protein